jgi:serine protease Do
VISQVDPNSPGAKAGLRAGDVVTELDGKAVVDAGQLQMVVGQKRPGDTIRLQVVRDSKATSISVTLEAFGAGGGTEAASGEQKKGRWGLSLGDLTQDARDELQAQSTTQGAVVQDVQPGSPADNAGLQRGDVIVEVNRRATKSAADAAQALSTVQKGEDALVLVWSNGGSTYRVLHPSQG